MTIHKDILIADVSFILSLLNSKCIQVRFVCVFHGINDSLYIFSMTGVHVRATESKCRGVKKFMGKCRSVMPDTDCTIQHPSH